MMNDIHWFGLTIAGWIKIPLLFLLWVVPLLFAKKILFLVIQRLAARTSTKLDDIFIQSANWPLSLIIVASFGFVLHHTMPLGEQFSTVQMGFTAVLIIAIALFINQFLVGLLEAYTDRFEILKTSGGIVRGFIHFIILTLGFLVLLDTFGVSVTPILASLGIGSLAVALAIQPTLENFFSGIQLIIDKPIQIGQFIRLDSGEEGHVQWIGWRSTWIRLPDNNIVILPNKALVNSKIINYYYPDKEAIVKVTGGVHYNSDLDHVQKVAKEVAKEVLNEVPSGVKNFDPVVLFTQFGDYSIHFIVVLKVNEYTQGGLLCHELIKRLHTRFNKEGIVMPYPIQAVNYDQEKVSLDIVRRDR